MSYIRLWIASLILWLGQHIKPGPRVLTGIEIWALRMNKNKGEM
jgi:hypothetical protein